MKDQNIEKLVCLEWLLYSLVIYRNNTSVDVPAFIYGYPVEEVFESEIYKEHASFYTLLKTILSECNVEVKTIDREKINDLADKLINEIIEITTPGK